MMEAMTGKSTLALQHFQDFISIAGEEYVMADEETLLNYSP